MALFELIEESIIKIPLVSEYKNDVIRELIDILKKAGKIGDTAEAYQAVLEREDLSSTGLGGGIAVPHAKVQSVPSLTAAIGIAPDGIDFEALDGQPSTVFFLLLAPPSDVASHLQALTEIAKISRDDNFCRNVIAAKSPAEVVSLFKTVS